MWPLMTYAVFTILCLYISLGFDIGPVMWGAILKTSTTCKQKMARIACIRANSRLKGPAPAEVETPKERACKVPKAGKL